MIQRHYFDEDEWETISDEVARDSLLKFYLNWQPILDELETGEVVYTDVAEYRKVRE